MSSISKAAKSGDTVELLKIMRNSLIEAIEHEDTHARELAPLSKRLQDVLRDLAALDSAYERDQLKVLQRVQSTLASAIEEGPPPRELAPLTRRLQDIVKEVVTLKERSLEERKSDDSSAPLEDETFDGTDL